MPIITSDLVLDEVEYILSSGTGTLDFAVRGEDDYYTWWGTEEADWKVDGVEHVENDSEDRLILYPVGGTFSCDISADGEEFNTGPVRCISKSEEPVSL